MFWNDPNLYSVAFKDTPNFPTPFYGTIPRYFHPYPTYLTPQMTPQSFNPQVPPGYFTPQSFNPQVPPGYFTPQMFNPQVPPAYFTPQMFNPHVPPNYLAPQAPYLHTPPVTPFIPPMMTPYNFTLPYFDRYRPLVF